MHGCKVGGGRRDEAKALLNGIAHAIREEDRACAGAKDRLFTAEFREWFEANAPDVAVGALGNSALLTCGNQAIFGIRSARSERRAAFSSATCLA